MGVAFYSFHRQWTSPSHVAFIYILHKLCKHSTIRSLLTHLHSERPKEAWRFWKYFPYKSIFFRKHLNEKCWSEDKQQISFKYFVKFCFIFKLFSKVWKWQTIFREELLSVNGLTSVIYLGTILPIPLHSFESSAKQNGLAISSSSSIRWKNIFSKLFKELERYLQLSTRYFHCMLYF